MNIFEPVVRFIQGLTNNFGITILICVFIDFLLILPFKYLKSKNNKKKKIVAPIIKELQNKYHINSFGPYKDDDESLDPEIQKMDLGQRQKEMNKEVMAAYKSAGYHAFTGWIPGILSIVITIFVYFGVSAACPEGIYSMSFSDIKNSGYNNVFGIIVIILNVVTSLSTALYTQWISVKEKIKNHKLQKKDIALMAFGILLPLGISLYIVFRARVAIITMILILQWFSFIQSRVEECIERRSSYGNR